MRQPRPDPETAVPPGEEPAARCAYCDRPFATDRLYWLHVGEYHADSCADDELAAHEEALDAERDDLFFYQLKVTIALGVLYSTTAISLMFFLGG